LNAKEGEKESDDTFSGSDADDESDGDEWVDVVHSEDEKDVSKADEEEPTKDAQEEALQRLEKAKDLLYNQVLTDEDFKKMEKLQMQKDLVAAKKGSSKKRKQNDLDATLASQV